MKLHIKVALLIAVVATSMGALNVYWFGKAQHQDLEHELLLRGALIAQRTLAENSRLLQANDLLTIKANLRKEVLAKADVEYLYISGPAGDVIAHSFPEAFPEHLNRLISSGVYSVQSIVLYPSSPPKKVIDIFLPAVIPAGGYIHIGMDNAAVARQVSKAGNQALLVLAVSATLAALIGIFMVRRVTLPVVRLAEQIRRYGQGGKVTVDALNLHAEGYESKILSDAVIQMLTDRQVIERKWDRREAEFGAIFNSMPDAVFFADLDRKIRMANPAAEKLFGYSMEELMGQRTEIVYADPADFQKQGQLRYRAGEGTQLAPYEIRYKRKDATVIHCETRGTQVKDNDGNIIGFVAMIRDISEQKRRRDELNQFKNTLDATLDCVFMFHADTLKFFYVNKGAIEQVGYSEKEMLNMTPVDIKPAYDEPGFRCLVQPLIDGERPALTFETVHRHKQGYDVPVEIFLQYIAHEDEPPRFVAIVRDLTERKRAEKVLHERHQILMLIINNAPLILFALDPQGVFTLSLGKGLENLGLKPGQVVGRSALDIHRENAQIISDIERALKGESLVSYVSVSGRHYETYYSPFYDSDGAFAGTIAVAVDYTERRQAEQELRDHRDLLEDLVAQRTQELAAANKEMEAFSYSVSHDLRSPLRSIDGFSHVLLDDYGSTMDATAMGYLHRIRAAAQHMAQLIDDLLELSRVTRGKLRIKTVNISKMAQAIVTELKVAEPQRQIHIEIQPGLEVQGDANLVQIMLHNLITNAWKYSSKKSVAEISLGRLDVPDERTFYIRDNGIGFDMRYADKLFGAFQRLHRKTEFEGTGIGLATVQRIVDRHGGKVWAESELNEGATFYFQLPKVPTTSIQ